MGGLTKVFYVLLFILIIGLVFYDNVWWAEYELMEGAERETQQIFGKIINISEDHFYLHTSDLDVKIESSNIPKIRKARYGETVVYVFYRKDGIIEGIDYHNYDYNYLLYFLSFIALVIFLVMFFRKWRITLRGFEDA